MLALSVRQPYAELILRGIKTIEYRSRATRIIGERFYLYAAGKWPTPKRRATAGATTRAGPWSLDLAMPSDGPGAAALPWMAELANGLRLFPHELPTGVIVGSATIEKVDRLESPAGDDGLWRWHLADVRRLKTPRKPTAHPQPVWWREG